MTDKELIALAAKAAQIEISDWSSSEDGFIRYYFITKYIFNPLKKLDDAMQLAISLGIDIELNGLHTHKFCGAGDWERNIWIQEDVGNCREDSVMRAIVRAAAEIGMGMK